MRSIVLGLIGMILVGGCASQPKKTETQAVSWPIPFAEPTPPASAPKAAPVTPVTPPVVKPAVATKTPPTKVTSTSERVLVGKVTMVKDAAQFAVLNFPVGTLPGIGQRLSVYRNGLKVGELKVTGPQMDVNTIADIATGEVRIGDEVRGH